MPSSGQREGEHSVAARHFLVPELTRADGAYRVATVADAALVKLAFAGYVYVGGHVWHEGADLEAIRAVDGNAIEELRRPSRTRAWHRRGGQLTASHEPFPRPFPLFLVENHFPVTERFDVSLRLR